MAYNDKWDHHFERRLGNVLRHIQRSPGLDGTALTKATQSLTSFDRQEVLEQLERDGKIRIETIRGKGRPKKAYWPATPECPVTHHEARQRVQGTESSPRPSLLPSAPQPRFQSLDERLAKYRGPPITLSV